MNLTSYSSNVAINYMQVADANYTTVTQAHKNKYTLICNFQ